MVHRSAIVLAALAVLMLAPVAAPGSWQIVDLGVSGANGIQCAGINDLGNVVASVTVAGNTEGVFYDKATGATTDIGYLDPTEPTTYVTGINNSNQVVGYSYLGDGGAYDKSHPFIWAPGNQITDLAPQELNNNWAAPQAFAINANGMVTGCNYNSATFYQNAVIWDGNAQLAKSYPPTTDAPTTWLPLAGLTTSYGNAINDGGDVIGSGKAGLTFKDFYYNGSTTSVYWGASVKYGWALNDAGIGVISNAGGPTYAYDGTNLVALTSTGAAGDAYAINNAANPMVVGTDGTTASVYTRTRPTAWTSQTLAAYATGLGANTSAWSSFEYADSVNDFGEVVGYGITTGGAFDAFALLRSDTPIPGDTNLDGKVDINDLTIVLAHYGQTAGMSWGTGDVNNDGKVDINDLTIVLANYGQSVGASAAGVAAVPEPSALALSVAGLAGLLACAWRRRP